MKQKEDEFDEFFATGDRKLKAGQDAVGTFGGAARYLAEHAPSPRSTGTARVPRGDSGRLWEAQAGSRFVFSISPC